MICFQLRHGELELQLPNASPLSLQSRKSASLYIERVSYANDVVSVAVDAFVFLLLILGCSCPTRPLSPSRVGSSTVSTLSYVNDVVSVAVNAFVVVVVAIVGVQH